MMIRIADDVVLVSFDPISIEVFLLYEYEQGRRPFSRLSGEVGHEVRSLTCFS